MYTLNYLNISNNCYLAETVTHLLVLIQCPLLIISFLTVVIGQMLPHFPIVSSNGLIFNRFNRIRCHLILENVTMT